MLSMGGERRPPRVNHANSYARAPLANKRVLVAEDEWLTAQELTTFLRQEHAVLLGPVPTVEAALDIVREAQPELALLDINLRGQMATPVVRTLTLRRIPFVLITAYIARDLPDAAFAAVPRVPKPMDERSLRYAIGLALRSHSAH